MKGTTLSFAISLCAIAALTGGTAVAQDKAAAASGALDGIVGSGTCTGTLMAMGKNPAHATTGKFHGEKTLDGHWVVLHYEQDPSAANPKPFEVMQYFGYDPAAKHFISVMVGNGDGAYSVGVSSGWKGNSITFDETEMARGKSGNTRESFVTGDSGLAGYTAWVRDKSGKWIKADEETCKSS